MKFLLICLVLGGLAHADQVNCVKWKDSSGNTVGTYCRPFSVKAGTGVVFSDNGQGVITITGTNAVAGAGGSDTQVNFNSGGTLAGSSGLTWNNSTSTLSATHITGLDRKPFIDVVRDCGAVADGTTDDYTVVQACFALYPQYTFYFPPTKTDGSCSYMFGTTLKPTGEGTTILGGGSGYKNSSTKQGGTVICFASGVTGIEVDMTGQNCSGCTIQNISIQGSEGHGHLQTPTALNLPSNLPQFVRSISSIQRTSNVLTVVTSALAAGGEALTQQVGSTVLIGGVVGDDTMNGRCVIATLTGANTFGENPTGFTCAQNGSDAGPFGAVGTVRPPTTGTSTSDGIRICSNFVTIKNVVVANFGRHGINADSLAADAMCPSNFSDDLVIENTMLAGNQANGFYCKGVDCNAGFMHGNPVYYNTLWGIEDQSSLGNTWVGNQISNNGSQWAVSSTPATKAISTIARTLVGGVSTVTVVLSVADTNLKLGSCVVIAGVTDASFNTTAGQCFFLTSYTNSTHFQYEQPGAPADASSSGGTSRMAKFSEVYLTAGVDSGAVKVATQSSTYSQSWFSNYIEGGQDCKFNSVVISIGGANMPTCVSLSTWKPATIATNGTNNSQSTNITTFYTGKDSNSQLALVPGKSAGTVRHFFTRWYNNNLGTDSWGLDADPAGASGTSGSWIFGRGTAGSVTRRLAFFGDTNASGVTRLNSESTSAVEINNDTGSGSGGLKVCDGSSNCITLNSATASTVGVAGAASALPATPSGYLIFKIGSTNFKIPYFAN